mmetsp:Transcript_100056/g.173693  ORF Transcript_100056/g.173693 Transcript_100056/m.173693 type:complete len:195 (-) Transcript_100056:35-619(-)
MADIENAAPSKGVTKRVWGKLQEPEKSRLASAEKRFGVSWKELHAYKDKMIYPVLPTMMAVEELPKDISLCESVYRGLDRCLEQGMSYESPSQPYARMQICKPHWIRFNKCVRRRDDLILRNVKKWERSYYSTLDGASKSEYLDDLDTKMRYFLYAASHTLDEQKKKKLEVQAQHCAERQATLLQPTSPIEDAL